MKGQYLRPMDRLRDLLEDARTSLQAVAGHGIQPEMARDAREMVARIDAELNREPPDTLTIFGFPIKVLDTGNDGEVQFIQNGKVVGRILLEKDSD